MSRFRGVFGLCLLASSVLLVGCSPNQLQSRTAQPFSLGGVTLGDSQTTLMEHGALALCHQSADDSTRCSLAGQEPYDFFGVRAKNVEVVFHRPVANVSGIHFTLDVGGLSSETVASAWKLDGHCAARAEIDEAVALDAANSSLAVKSLAAAALLPVVDGDFVCVSKGALMRYRAQDSRARVEMLSLRPDHARDFEFVFHSVDLMSSASTGRTNDDHPQSASVEMTAQCQTLSQQDPKSYLAGIRNLAASAGVQTSGGGRRLGDFVAALCGGDTEGPSHQVAWGYFTKMEADAIASALGIKVNFRSTMPEANSFQFAMERLKRNGVGSMHLERPAMAFATDPSSECGQLTRRAVAGEERAVQELDRPVSVCL